MSQVDWSKLGDIKYWLEGIAGGVSITPVIEKGSFFFWFFLYLFSILLFLGIALRVAQAFLHPNHPFQNKFPFWGNNFIWMGLLGFFWFTLREVSVAFLGARIWLLVGLVWFLTIIAFIIRYFIVFFPLENQFYIKTYKSPLQK